MPEQSSATTGGRGYGYLGWFGVSLLVIVLDQMAKYAITRHFTPGEMLPLAPVFNLTLSYNRGAAFGMLNQASGWQHWLFVALALAASGWIAWLLPRHRGQRLFSFALALIMGGALGNLVDRFSNHGYVVDFLDFHWGDHHFATFNLADSAITCGAILLLLEGYIGRRGHSSGQTQ